jgi:DNA-binding NtrC family response regulator
MEPLPAFHGLVGQSAPMRALFDRIRRVAPYDVPGLILGETGTGKELVAAALHRLSRRRGARFEAVNCGALTRELLLSELFGHERGAFTGAVERRPGLLRDVDGGTVLLDEVGELVPEAQSMLLRFLATGEVRPVGATRVVHPDVRILAATHRDLRTASSQGALREDLYYRLRRVVLEVPTLRERREDLPLLVEHLRRQANARYGLTIDGIAASAMARLVAYPWPGNVRELEAVVEEAMIVKGQGLLDSTDLPLDPMRQAPSASPVLHVPRPSTLRPATRCLRTALEIAATRAGVSRSELVAESGFSRELARRALTDLARLGHLRRVGRGRGTRYVVG